MRPAIRDLVRPNPVKDWMAWIDCFGGFGGFGGGWFATRMDRRAVPELQTREQQRYPMRSGMFVAAANA
jgi:hypothetical protein